MNKQYKEAFVEVIEVLNHSSHTVLEKIPQKLINLFNINKSETYVANIDFSNANWEETLMPTTQAILALLYRDFLTSNEEREKLINKEKEAKLYAETLGINQVDASNLFDNNTSINTSENIEISNNCELVEFIEIPWYKRIYYKLLAILNIKHKK